MEKRVKKNIWQAEVMDKKQKKEQLIGRSIFVTGNWLVLQRLFPLIVRHNNRG